MTLNELATLDVAFVSLTEALDMTTPSGRALAAMLAVFAEFERDMLRELLTGHGRGACRTSKSDPQSRLRIMIKLLTE